MRRSTYRHELVASFPDEPEAGVLYVSIQYATALHHCMCGCGEAVVTPFGPVDWRMIYDGETVSLAPSIGNWSTPCQSHYYLTGGRVRWAGRWSREQIIRGRERDRLATADHFREIDDSVELDDDAPEPPGRHVHRRWRRFLGAKR